MTEKLLGCTVTRKDLEWQDKFLTRIKRAGKANTTVLDRLACVRGEIALERRRAGDTRGQHDAMKKASPVVHAALRATHGGG